MRPCAASRPRHEMAFEVLVEGHAVAKQILDPVARLTRQKLCDFHIDDAGAGADRILGMMLGAVAFGDRRGDAGLRPKARSAFAEPRAGDDGDWKRRQLERGEQPGKAGAHHHDAARPALHSRWELAVRCHRRIRPKLLGLHQWLRLIMRSTAARARLGDRGIDRHLLLEEDEAVEDLRQRDPLHMRAEIAGPHELDVRRLDRDVVAHRAFGRRAAPWRADCPSPI